MDKNIIVLVETNLFFSTKIISRLQSLGYSTVLAFSFTEIQEKLDPRVAAVILDLSARDCDVVDILRQLKANAQTAAIPTVGFAGHKDREKLQQARDLGCSAVVTNFAATEELPTILKSIL